MPEDVQRQAARGKQVAHLVLNANGDAERFASFDVPVAPDVVDGFPGPLAGILTGMRWARAQAPAATWLVSAAADAPFMPRDLVARLGAAADRAGARLACARSAGQAHPVFGLWRIALVDDLARAVTEEGLRKVDLWTARHGCIDVDFPVSDVDPFFNVNRPEDLAEAETMISAAR